MHRVRARVGQPQECLVWAVGLALEPLAVEGAQGESHPGLCAGAAGPTFLLDAAKGSTGEQSPGLPGVESEEHTRLRERRAAAKHNMACGLAE